MEPTWMQAARAELGVKEAAGAADNPRIVEYLKSGSGDPALYSQDETPWCAGFANWCLQKGSEGALRGTGSLMAKSFLGYGRDVSSNPQPGAIAVFDRPPNPASGHVAFFVRWLGSDGIEVLGGNQSNAVTIQKYSRSQLRALRWPNSVPLPGEALGEQGTGGGSSTRPPAVPPREPPRRPPSEPVQPAPSAGGFFIGVFLVVAVASVIITKGKVFEVVAELLKKVF